MFERRTAALNDSEISPDPEVSGHLYRSRAAELRFARAGSRAAALLDHHVEEVLAALDDLARRGHVARSD